MNNEMPFNALLELLETCRDADAKDLEKRAPSEHKCAEPSKNEQRIQRVTLTFSNLDITLEFSGDMNPLPGAGL